MPGLDIWSSHPLAQYKAKATQQRLAKSSRVGAEQGDAAAQSDLAFMYLHGSGVPLNYAEAARWYRAAADQGYAKVKPTSAPCIYGKGVRQNYAEAARWYRMAGGQGYAIAQEASAPCITTAKDPAGLHGSCSLVPHCRRTGLRECSIRPRLHVSRGQRCAPGHCRADRWCRKAAEQGDANAQHALGFSYAHGQGVPQDYAESIRWYRKAAEQDDRKAQIILSVMYYRGQGAPQDYAQTATDR